MRQPADIAPSPFAAYIQRTLATDTRTSPETSTPRLGRKAEAQRVDRKSLRPLARLLPFIWRYKWRVVAVWVVGAWVVVDSWLAVVCVGVDSDETPEEIQRVEA